MRQVKKENKKNRFGIFLMAISSLFSGIFAGIYGMDQIKNYYHPYEFGFIFCSFGLVIGLVFVNYIKPYLKFDKNQLNQIWLFKTYISVGFIGIMLALGSLTNKKLSKIIQCDKFMVVEKTIREDRFRSPGANFLFVDINGEIQRLSCSTNYWVRTIAGQKIGLCLFESKIGFDFIVINGDKR